MARCVHSIDRKSDTPFCDVMIWVESEASVLCNGRHAVCLGEGDKIKDIREEKNHDGKDDRTGAERGDRTTQDSGTASSCNLLND